MTVDCLHEPAVLAFAKAFGASIGILGAALAWLLNNVVRWTVWRIGEWRSEYEPVKGLKAEIASNARSERNWAAPEEADKLIAALKTDLGPYKPWAPYVAVIEADIIFDGLKGSINRLPSNVIEKVVEYYNLTSGLTKQLEDFRSEAFTQLSRPRQTTVIRGVYELGAAVITAADKALEALEKRVQTLRIVQSLGFIGLALAAFVGVPLACSAAKSFVAEGLIPAAEWASACDLAPKSDPDHRQYKP
jgi:hypothetical protein